MEIDEIEITRLFGIELEVFLTDRNGKIANKADAILGQKYRNMSVVKEAGHSMLEMLTYPHRSAKAVFSTFLKDFENLAYETEINDLGIFNYGTFPGKNNGILRDDKRYAAQEKVLGKDVYHNGIKCIGFHFHYSLPRNSFDKNTQFFYPNLPKKKQDKTLALYNLLIALDPVISTFMQSSPYIESKKLGKDARVVKWRGDPVFEDKDTYYLRYPEFGTLNNYQTNFNEFKEEIAARAKLWKSLIETTGISFLEYSKKGREPSILDTSWKPVKITTHGTVEYRGADMNSLKNVVGMSTMMFKILKYVQNNKIQIVVGEDYFKLEDDVLYVPNHDILIQLQKEAALFGLESELVYNYCKALMEFVKDITRTEMMPAIRSFLQMLEERKTKSDEIISYVKKKQGYIDTVEDETVHDFSIKTAESIFKDILMTKKVVDKVFVF